MNKKKSAINEESLPGILLLAATLIALVIANTPLNDFYNYILYELSFEEEFNLR